jgi:hypothetical protein
MKTIVDRESAKEVISSNLRTSTIKTDEKASQLERTIAASFNRKFVEGPIQNYCEYNGLIYLLISELREEIMAKKLDNAGKICLYWGSPPSGARSIRINRSGTITEYDDDGRSEDYPFTDFDIPFIQNTDYISSAIQSIFEVSKSLGIDLKGKYLGKYYTT